MVILKASTRPVTKTTIFPSSTMMMMTVWLLSRPFVRFKCSEMTKPSLFVPKPLVKSWKKNIFECTSPKFAVFPTLQIFICTTLIKMINKNH
jgi:hypothetical protein